MSETTAHRAVRVRNDGDTDYVDGYNGQRYVIGAGADAFVPFDAACLWLGDPRLQNLGPRDKHRADEFERIATRMGAAEKGLDYFNEVRPRLSVFNTDTGQQMTMVADDPDGPGEDVFGTGGGSDDVHQQLHQLRTAMAKMVETSGDSEMASVLSDLGIGDVNRPTADASAKPAASGGEPPVDTPKRTRVSAGRAGG